MDIDSRIDGRMMAGELVTGNFFQVLGVSAALGRTLTPADDIRHAGRQVIVLSHKGWSRLFANDPDIVGRSVIVSGFRYEIVGVMPERFRGLGLAPPDYWAHSIWSARCAARSRGIAAQAALATCSSSCR